MRLCAETHPAACRRAAAARAWRASSMAVSTRKKRRRRAAQKGVPATLPARLGETPPERAPGEGRHEEGGARGRRSKKKRSIVVDTLGLRSLFFPHRALPLSPMLRSTAAALLRRAASVTGRTGVAEVRVCERGARVFPARVFWGGVAGARVSVCALAPTRSRLHSHRPPSMEPGAAQAWAGVGGPPVGACAAAPFAQKRPPPSNSQPCLSRCLPAPQALPAPAAASTSSSDSRWGGAVLVGGAAVGLAAALAPALAEDEADHGLHPPRFAWSHEGLFSSYDYASIRRGHQVYTQVREGSGERRVGERAKHKSRDSPSSPSPTRSAPPATLLGRCTTATWWACATRRRRPR